MSFADGDAHPTSAAAQQREKSRISMRFSCNALPIKKKGHSLKAQGHASSYISYLQEGTHCALNPPS
jgi:hypothetical protein